MKVSLEISLYPLTPSYEAPILGFISNLRAAANISVATNQLSTQVCGEYDAVMDALKAAMRPTLSGDDTVSFVVKILNVEIEPGAAVEVG